MPDLSSFKTRRSARKLGRLSPSRSAGIFEERDQPLPKTRIRNSFAKTDYSRTTRDEIHSPISHIESQDLYARSFYQEHRLSVASERDDADSQHAGTGAICIRFRVESGQDSVSLRQGLWQRVVSVLHLCTRASSGSGHGDEIANNVWVHKEA